MTGAEASRTARERDVAPEPHDGVAIAASVERPDRFAVVFERHFPALHRYVARRVGTSVADDLTAQVFAEAFAHRARFETDRANAAPWLYGIATNLLRRHHRREAARWRAFARHGVDPVAVDDGASARAATDAAGAAVARVLARLPKIDRDALLLVEWAGLTYEEIASVMDVPVGTVRSRINRARARVRVGLEGIPDE
jgi:RNA polymerase sigma factor (sigma-70 family)